MKTTIGILALSAGTLLGDAQVSLLTGPIVNPANGNSYYLTSPTTWVSAEAFARTMGGHLATIRNAQEDGWIYSTFIHNSGVTDTLWIGISDAAQEGTFVWAGGESTPYRNWAPGEPNNLSNIENYGRYFQPYHEYAGKWNDAPNQAPSNGIIELLCSPHRATATAQLVGGSVIGATLTDVGCGYWAEEAAALPRLLRPTTASSPILISSTPEPAIQVIQPFTFIRRLASNSA